MATFPSKASTNLALESPPVVFTLDSSAATCHRTGRSIAVDDLIRVTRHRPVMSRMNGLRFEARNEHITVDLWRNRLPENGAGIDAVVQRVLEQLPPRAKADGSSDL